MLPSTGLFKAIVCPFFEADQCMRPFCHYKHLRKDPVSPIKTSNAVASVVEAAPAIQLLEAPQYVYKPTPKAILAKEQQRLQQLTTDATAAAAAASSSDPPAAAEPIKKRPRLEYVPTLKTVGQNHYGQDRAVHPAADSVAEYQPTAPVTSAAPNEPDATAARDDAMLKPPAPKERSSSSGGDRHRSSSSSSSSSKGADRKHRSGEHRSSDASRDKDRQQLKEHNSSRSSSSSSTKHSSSRSSSSSSHRRSTENTHKSSSSSSSSRDKKSGSSSSTRSSSSRRDSKSSTKSATSSTSSTAPTKEPTAPATAPTPTPSADVVVHNDAGSDFASDSDEDEVMAQCRMIFDEFQPPAADAKAASASPAGSSTPTVTAPNGHSDTATQSATKSADQMSLDFDEALRKKRTAHDGADNGRPLCAGAPTAAQSARVHVHSAMQTVFKRQEIVRIQLEKMEAKQTAERLAKEKRLADLEADRQARAKAALRRTAHQPASATVSSGSGGRIAHQPSAAVTAINVAATRPATAPVVAQPRPATARVVIAPVSSAMMRARQKVEEMRAAKQPTVSRTASKLTGRVAHAAPAVAERDAKPPPPVLEPQSTKISLNLRMQYYMMMVKHCRTIYAECEDAWERAQAVELGVFNKCNTLVIYKKSATLAINTLRKEAVEAEQNCDTKTKTVSHESILNGRKAQNASWSVNKQSRTPVAASASANPLDQLSSAKVFDLIYALRLTDDQLHDNGFPRPAERPGYAQIHRTYAKARPNSVHDRYCARCGAVFNLKHFDDDTVVDACNYHAKSPGFLRGSNVNAHRCCQQPSGSPGCMYANHHVTDSPLEADKLTGFVRTIARPEEYRTTRADVFALDCEMCYTTLGLELTRVTVVNFERKTVYDTMVRPDNKVIDYNTVYSGITAEMLAPVRQTLRDVQAVLLSMFHARTVLVGHSLDSDLKALKLIHDVVVDTSVLFPHKLGPPKKRALKTLCIEHLGRIIQESEAGHDSAEDAEVCIQLVRYYLQNQIL